MEIYYYLCKNNNYRKKQQTMKCTRNFTLSVLLMLIGTMGIKAQTVGLEEAEQKALAFVKKSNKAKAPGAIPSRALSLAYTSKEGDETYYYVFNNGQEGYVIIGGDEVANDVLGYSDSGTFCYDKLPDNMKWFLSCYDHQISAAIKQVKAGKVSADDVAQAKRRAARKAPKANIGYLLQTKWDQVAPFNSQIPLNQKPNFSGDYALATGCVATAGAQIMKYHEWPDRGVGSHTDPYTVNGEAYSADFGSTEYDWSKMQNTYDYDKYTGSAADIAVGTLMYHVGVAVDMKYGQLRSGGSGTDARNLAEALVNNFKYSKGITYHERTYYSDEQWEDMVYNELAEQRPVLYSGQQESGSGHAFVCDGYQDGLYHINWGWSGSSDAYFLLTPTASSGSALCPEGSGSGGGEAGQGYYLTQCIGIGITPDRDGTSQPVKSAFTRGISLVTTSAAPGGNITVNGYYCGNGSVVAQSYKVKMKFTDMQDESDVTIGTYTLTTGEISSGYSEGSNAAIFVAPSTLVPGHAYYVTLMYENSQGEYVDMPQPQNWEPQVLTVTESQPTGIMLKELFVDNGGYITMNSFNFKAKVKNNTSFNWSTTYLKCKITFGSQIIDVYSEPFKFFSGEEAIVTLDIYEQYGQYFPYYFEIGNQITTCIEDYDGNQISEPITFQFCDELPLSYTLTSAGWGTLCLPYTAEVPDGLTAYTVTATEGNNLVKEEVTTLEYNKPYLITGTPDTYHFNGPATPEAENLTNGLLVGNTTDAQTYAPQASYVLQNLPAQDGLAFYEVQIDGKQKVRQYGAYLNANQGTSAASLRFRDEETTGIVAAEPRATTTPAYNLNGVRVDRNARGFVIVNGKLIYNK